MSPSHESPEVGRVIPNAPRRLKDKPPYPSQSDEFPPAASEWPAELNRRQFLEVTAATVALQADRADVHFTQPAREVNDLPLAGTLGRNYQSLMAIVP